MNKENVFRGDLRKMHAEAAQQIRYSLPIGEMLVSLSPFMGRHISLQFHGEINCIACGRCVKKSFNQGYCFPCSQKLAACDICIVRPERCHYDKGTCREPEWGQSHCMQPHVVYLANSSGIKVGITRHSQVPTRWIDQGATQALPLYHVTSRYLAGLLEVALKEHVADKTDWRRMLKGAATPVSLKERRDALWQLCSAQETALDERFGRGSITRLNDAELTEFNYPVLKYPEKVKALNLDKTPGVSGLLQGIKGQYLILDTGVLNVRKYTGYNVTFSGEGA